MKSFRVSDKKSGKELGIFYAENREEAIKQAREECKENFELQAFEISQVF